MKARKQRITWKIGGEAGFGIMSSGTMLAKAFSRHGYHIIASNEYPSLIRGGHNVITVGISTTPIHSLTGVVDILVALNKETIDLHKNNLHEGSYVIYDSKDWEPHETDFPQNTQFIAVPLSNIVKLRGAESVMRNTVALGVTTALLGADFSVLADVIASQFGEKGKDIVEENTLVARYGYDFIKKEYGLLDSYYLDFVQEKAELLTMNGSEAVGIGALDGGMKFAAIYPMTPINSLISLFADHEKEFRITYIQPEDEISGINMAIGASYAGVRSMVATSGGGFSLMVEGVSLAGIMEVPLVIDLGMRPGPATGMPTWTEQGELLFPIFSGHGEFVRIILAPGDAPECYRLSKFAFDLSQEYQVPVFILTDKYLNENLWTVQKKEFEHPSVPKNGERSKDKSHGDHVKRYDMSVKNGVSARSFPGDKNGLYIANSYEHDEYGYTTEDPGLRIAMSRKRLQKEQAIIDVSPLPSVYGDNESDITFIAYGSTKGPILEAMDFLKEKGIRTKLIHFSWIYPFNGKRIKDLLDLEKRLIDVEGNGTGQFAKLLKQETGLDIQEKLLKNNGRQWLPEEIVEKVI